MEIIVGNLKILVIYQVNSSSRCIFDNIKDIDFQVNYNLFEVYHNGELKIVQKIQPDAITINGTAITIENVLEVLKSLMNNDSNGNNSNGSNSSGTSGGQIQEALVFDTVGGYVESTGNQSPSTAPANVKAVFDKIVCRLGKWHLPNGDRDYVCIHNLKGVGTTKFITGLDLILQDNNGKWLIMNGLFNNEGASNPGMFIYPNGNINEQSDRITIRRRGGGGTLNDSRFEASNSSGAVSRGFAIIHYMELKDLN